MLLFITWKNIEENKKQKNLNTKYNRKEKDKVKKRQIKISKIMYLSNIFSLYLNSTQKISGNNNDAIFYRLV